MATLEELFALYAKRERSVLHKQVKNMTQKTDEEVCIIFDTLLSFIKDNAHLLIDISANEHVLHNWLRTHAKQLSDLSNSLQIVSIREQHRFCQRVKELLPGHVHTLPYVEQAIKHARRDLVQLVFVTSESGDEQLIGWIQSYLDNEVMVVQFTDMWERIKPSLQWQAQGKTRHQEDTEDLLQQTYFNALRYIRKHSRMPEEGKIKAWLSKTMHHAFVDDVRDRRRLLTEPLMDEHAEQHLDEEDVEKTVIEEQEQQELERILQSLSEEDRRVMELHLLRSMSLREIAEELHENLETIRARFKRARPKILAKLSAKTLHEYLEHLPLAQLKVRKLLQGYIPNKATKGYHLGDILIKKEQDVLIRSILSLHVEGYDNRDIAELLTVEKENTETFELRVAAIQKCLDENLPRLFSTFYSRV